eukprot:TRINITY_DN11503_c0_g1_i1.p1 TRINITY_DN11503_c0_g1~~TRINITY_DN11503_c0_g1_i1.p1  ORF type:complete len:447 (+),score=96.94 TRINITY_DN11503_c0_g1_i1:1101-2441(+)
MLCGTRICLVAVLSDVSQTKEIVRMKEVEEYKDILLASVTHELRTPLNCMIPLLAEATAQSVPDDDFKREYLFPVLNNSKLLLSLINDILDYSKMRRKSLRFIFDFFSVDELINDLRQLFEIQIRSRNLYLRFERDESLPHRVYGEKERTRQILINLIGNAIKFTRKGGITVEIKRIDQDKMRFSVTDTGIGISIEDQAKLFRAFGQVEAEEYLRMNNQGTGLGLMISNKLAQMLGSERIFVNSTYGQGSTFYFDTSYKRPESSDDANVSFSEEPPRQLIYNFSVTEMIQNPAPCSAPDIRVGDEKRAGPKCTCRRVLIAEDNDYNRLALTKAVRKLRFATIEACDGQEAYEQVKDLMREDESCGSPNCRRLYMIISDQNMPRMTGEELHKKVRQLSNSIPFVLASAFNSDESKDYELKSFLDFIVSKPITLEQLSALVKKIGKII